MGNFLKGSSFLYILLATTILISQNSTAKEFEDLDPVCNYRLNDLNHAFTPIVTEGVGAALALAGQSVSNTISERTFGPFYVSPNPKDCTETAIKKMAIGEAWKTCMGMPEMIQEEQVPGVVHRELSDKDISAGIKKMGFVDKLKRSVKPFGPAAIKVDNLQIVSVEVQNGNESTSIKCDPLECRVNVPVTKLLFKGDFYMISLIELANQGIDFTKMSDEERNAKIEEALESAGNNPATIFHLKDWQFEVNPRQKAPNVSFNTCLVNGNAGPRSLDNNKVIVDEPEKNFLVRLFSEPARLISDTIEGCVTLNKIIQLQPSTGQIELTAKSMSADYYMTEEAKKALVTDTYLSVFNYFAKEHGEKSTFMGSFNDVEGQVNVGIALNHLISHFDLEGSDDYKRKNKAWLAELDRIAQSKQDEIDTRAKNIPAELADLRGKLKVAETKLMSAKQDGTQREIEDKEAEVSFLKTKISFIEGDPEDQPYRYKGEIDMKQTMLEQFVARHRQYAFIYYALKDAMDLNIDPIWEKHITSEKMIDYVMLQFSLGIPHSERSKWGLYPENRNKMRKSKEFQAFYATWKKDGLRKREYIVKDLAHNIGQVMADAHKRAVLDHHHNGRVHDWEKTMLVFGVFNQFIAETGFAFGLANQMLTETVVPRVANIANAILDDYPVPICVAGETVTKEVKKSTGQ